MEEHPVVDTVGERERVAQAEAEKLGVGVEHRVGEGVLVLDTERVCESEWVRELQGEAVRLVVLLGHRVGEGEEVWDSVPDGVGLRLGLRVVDKLPVFVGEGAGERDAHCVAVVHRVVEVVGVVDTLSEMDTAGVKVPLPDTPGVAVGEREGDWVSERERDCVTESVLDRDCVLQWVRDRLPVGDTLNELEREALLHSESVKDDEWVPEELRHSVGLPVGVREVECEGVLQGHTEGLCVWVRETLLVRVREAVPESVGD